MQYSILYSFHKNSKNVIIFINKKHQAVRYFNQWYICIVVQSFICSKEFCYSKLSSNILYVNNKYIIPDNTKSIFFRNGIL